MVLFGILDDSILRVQFPKKVKDMHILVLILHVVACLALILIVLLQTGKGADLGAAFGGSSQTVFGSQGAGGFLAKLTTAMAVIFMLTSLGLTYLSSHRVQATIMEEAAKATLPEAGQEAASDEQPAGAAEPDESKTKDINNEDGPKAGAESGAESEK